MNTKNLLLTLGVVLLAVQFAFAQISFTGGTLSEDFDSMGADGEDAPAGWLAGSYTTVQNRTDPASEPMSDILVPNDGSSDVKATSYNYGTEGSSERALGNIGTTASGDRAIQVAITNDSDEEIPAIGLTYTGEQWRDYQGTSENGPERLQLFFSTEAGSDFIAYPALDFIAPSDLGLNAAIDGNDPANRVTIGGFLRPPTAIGLGETFYLTWHDWNDLNTNDHGLAIDDVRIEVVDNVGDFNSDGAIDLADFQILAENFHEGTTFAQGDATFDGAVDLNDFIDFRKSYEAAAGGVAAVPEPNGLALGLISAALLLVTRRRMFRA